MLISLEANQLKAGFDQIFMPQIGKKEIPTEIAPGIYSAGFNFRHNLVEGLVKSDYPFEPEFDYKDDDIRERMAKIQKIFEENPKLGLPTSSYGVCDEPMQILVTFPALATDERKFVIGACQLLKANEPPEGGWRWHKWGTYIGEQEPKCEYLHDEPVIEEVWVYHILELK